jgi:hypothetical protein
MTDGGKFICDLDNKTFKTREDSDNHLSEAHVRSSCSKGWYQHEESQMFLPFSIAPSAEN